MKKVSTCGRLAVHGAIVAFILMSLSGCSDSPTESSLPSLVISEDSFVLSGAVDISGPSDQLVEISVSNGASVSYSAIIKSTGTRTNPWMRLLNETGLTPDTMIMRFTIGSTSEGTFIDTIVVSSSSTINSPRLIEVRLTMRAVLTVSTSVIRIVALSGENKIDSQSVQVASNGSGPFDFTATTNRSWLTVSHPQGVGPIPLTVYVDPAGVGHGEDTGRVNIAADVLFDSPKLVTVILNVTAWAPQKAPFAQDLAGVHFLDENVGWAVGRVASVAEVSGYVVRTADGGENWELITSSWPQPLGSVEFINTTTGWIVGGNGLVRKTVDGGTTWIPQNTPAAIDEIDLWDADFIKSCGTPADG